MPEPITQLNTLEPITQLLDTIMAPMAPITQLNTSDPITQFNMITAPMTLLNSSTFTPGIPPSPTSLPEPITPEPINILGLIGQLNMPEPIIQLTTPAAIIGQQQGLIASEVSNNTKLAPKQTTRAGSKVKKGAKKSGNDASGQPQALATDEPLPDLTNVPCPVRKRKRKEPGDRAYEIRAEELEKKKRAHRDGK